MLPSIRKTGGYAPSYDALAARVAALETRQVALPPAKPKQDRSAEKAEADRLLRHLLASIVPDRHSGRLLTGTVQEWWIKLNSSDGRMRVSAERNLADVQIIRDQSGRMVVGNGAHPLLCDSRWSGGRHEQVLAAAGGCEQILRHGRRGRVGYKELMGIAVPVRHLI